jgi:LysR family glycine cleavage system transcriptional activator
MPDAMARTIPPLNPLHVFDTVSRLGSFTAAAAALGVTQSAVSRQIGVLEGYLGTSLFQRTQQGVTLTPAGERYRAEIEPAFARIAAATAALRQPDIAAPVRLRVYATFAVKWLLPRLSRFHALHPGIEVQLSTTAAPVDFARDAVDLAVQFGSGDWPGLEHQRLLPDLLQPVCSPALLAAAGGRLELDDLRRHRLLHSHYRRHDWREWLDLVGRLDLLQSGPEFPSSVLTLQAAAEGLGIAIGQITLLADDLHAGRLIPLFGRPFERPLGHYLVWPAARPPGGNGRALAKWLAAEAASNRPRT